MRFLSRDADCDCDLLVGQGIDPEGRAMYWRICLGVISNSQSGQWKRDLFDQVIDYRALLHEILPDISAIDADPLSHMLGASNEKGWDKYFEVIIHYSISSAFHRSARLRHTA